MEITESLKQKCWETVDSYTPSLNSISKYIWENPELAFTEHKAHDLLTDALEKEGFLVERKYVLETAFRGEFGDDENASLPRVAVFCEYDALPGLGHACGHNLIAECGIGACIAIKHAMESSASKIGKLLVFGTPAEEGGCGKQDLINAGAFAEVDIAIMAHPSQYSTPKPPYLSFTKLDIRYEGKAAHASSYPWEGINALDAAVMCYQNLSCLRQQMKPSWRLHGIILKGGEQPNIIPDESVMQYYARTPTEKELTILKGKVVQCIEAAATATGCKVKYEFAAKGYQSLIHNDTLAKVFEENGKKIGVEFSQDPAIINKFGGSTDMGNVSRVVPSLHPKFYIGTKASGHSKEFCVASGDPVAQPYTLNVAKALACTAIDVFTKPDLLARIKQDFKDDMAAEETT